MELNIAMQALMIGFYRHSFITDSLFRLISFAIFISFHYSVLCVQL